MTNTVTRIEDFQRKQAQSQTSSARGSHTLYGGGDGGGTMEDRILDAKIAATEARTDTKFAQLLGKLDVIAERIGGIQGQIIALDKKADQIEIKVGEVDTHSRSAKGAIISTVIATGIAVAALAWAGVQIFQGGIGLGMSAAQLQQPATQPAKR